MITVSQETLAKINNPIQLPSNQGDPFCIMIVQKEYGGTADSRFSEYIKSGSITSKYDDYSYSCSLTLLKNDKLLDYYDYESYFSPGSKLTLFVAFGRTSPTGIHCDLFSGVIDECSWDEDGENFTISATSNINHYLKACTMGDVAQLTGLSHEVGSAIMDLAGVTAYYITIGTYEWTYTYRSSDTCLSAIEQMYPIFPKAGESMGGGPGFGILEGPDGTVVVGYWYDRTDPTHGIPVGNYVFNVGSDCFSMSTRMTSDKCYSKVYATGKAADGVDLEEVHVDVVNFQNWIIPPNKIYHANFNGYTMQEDLQDWAETVALELANQGVTREFTGPLRPQLTVGDIATMQFTNGSAIYAQQGVITSITHHIGMEGFSTDFSVDSGGVYSAVSGWSSQMKANGYNRRQKLADTVHEIAEQVTEKALNEHDPISIQNMWDEEGEEEVDIITHRNELKIAYDGRNWQDLLPDDEEEPEEEEES